MGDEARNLLTLDAMVVAPALIGWTLIVHSELGDTAGMIVETEAYRGCDDPASHAFGGLPSKRTSPMFLSGGAIYVYFTYGMHYCMNLVTGAAGEAQAVLIRALEPSCGLELMRQRRDSTCPNQKLASGPANVCRALGVNATYSGTRLGIGMNLVPPHSAVLRDHISTGPRIGITRGSNLPWRFWLTGNPSVSK